MLFCWHGSPFWRQLDHRRGKPKRGREGPSELERSVKGHEPGIEREGSGGPVPERVRKCRGRRWKSGLERLSRRPSGCRFGKASGSGFGHDARTASEHLAPLPVQDHCPPENERGPTAFAVGPACQRCDRVISTCVARIQCVARESNNILSASSLISPDVMWMSASGGCLRNGFNIFGFRLHLENVFSPMKVGSNFR